MLSKLLPAPKMQNFTNLQEVKTLSRSKQIQLGWNCFDIAVGIERKDLIIFALKNADDLTLRRLLANEIKSASIISQTSGLSWQDKSLGLPESMLNNQQLNSLVKNFLEIENDINVQSCINLCNFFIFSTYKNHRELSYYELENFFDNHENRELEHKAFEMFECAKDLVSKALQDLDNFCSSKKIYTKYVMEYYGKNNWFIIHPVLSGENSTGMIDIVAYMLKAKINIYTFKKLTYSTENYGSRIINVEYNGKNHFKAISSKSTTFQHQGFFKSHNHENNGPNLQLAI